MPDPYYSNTKLLLPFEQRYFAPGSTNPNVLCDYSKYPLFLNPEGSATLATTGAKYGTTCGNLPSVGSWWGCNDGAFSTFGTGDFTIEGWVKTSSASAALVDKYTGSAGAWQLILYSGKLTWWTSAVIKTGSLDVNDNVWHHFAAVRSSGNLLFFVDGVQDGTPTAHASDLSVIATTFAIGAQVNNRNSNYDLVGLLDEIRITQGTARYTANFTPAQLDTSDSVVPAFTPRNIESFNKAIPFEWSTLPKSNIVVDSHKSTEKNDLLRSNWGGAGSISGTVKIGTNAVQRTVRLYEEKTGVLILEQPANADGTYLFKNLRKDLEYTVTSREYGRVYNDVVAARVTPV